MSEDMEHYFDDENEGPPCPKCDGQRTVNCHCGGDFCFCENDGERDCPLCYGEGVASPERAERYLQFQREMYDVMRKGLELEKPKPEGPPHE